MKLEQAVRLLEEMAYLSLSQRRQAKRILKNGCAAGIILPVMRRINNAQEDLAGIEGVQGFADNLEIKVIKT